MEKCARSAAYILEGAKCLHDIPSFMMQVEYNNMRIQDEFIYGMITNSTSVGGFKGMTGKMFCLMMVFLKLH